MNFDSPDVAKDFPGLYGEELYGEEERQSRGRRDFGKKDKSKKDKKDKGYVMFEEEDSEEEPMIQDDRSPAKIKKHKPSFKFTKRQQMYKPKEKDKDREKEEKREKERREKEEREKREKREKEERERREKKEKEEKERKEKEWKEQKKKEKEQKLKLKKNKLLSGSKQSINSTSSVGSTDGGAALVFGVPLFAAVERSRCHDGIELPVIFRECIDYIEEYGLTCEGIYRISGVKSKVQGLKDMYNKGQHVYLLEHEPSIVASLLKQYLRDLPEPVLTMELTPKFEQASTVKNVKLLVEEFKRLISLLPTPNRLLLSWMIVHMTHIISREKQNKMSLQNVSIVLSPTMQISHRVLNVLFTYAKILFRDTVIKKYVPPLRPVSSRWSLELPDSPSAIEEELHKQESLLDQLHHELLQVKDTEKEERLWEVQRVVTQLKRKLKHARKAHEAIAATAKRDDDLAKEKLQAVHKQQLKLNIESRTDRSPVAQAKVAKNDAKGSPQMKRSPVIVKKKEEVEAEVKVEEVVKEVVKEVVVDKAEDGKEEVVQDVEDERDLVTPTLDTEVHPPDSEDSDTEPIEEGPEIPLEEMEKLKIDTQVEKESENVEEKVEMVVEGEDHEEVKDGKVHPQDAATPCSITEEVFDVDDVNESEEKVVETEVKEEEAITVKVEDVDENREEEVADKEVEEVIEKTVEEVVEKKEEELQVDIVHEQPETAEEPAKEELEENKVQVSAEITVEEKSEPTEIAAADQHEKEPEVEDVMDESQEPQVSEEFTEERSEEEEEEEEEEVFDEYVEEVPVQSPMGDVPFSSILMPEKLYDPEKMGDPLDYYQQAANFEDDEEYLDLLRQHTALLLEEEELLATGSELRQKIESEHSEIERLHQDISDVRAIRQDLYSSDEYEESEEDDDGGGSSDESLEEEILLEMLQQLEKENKDMELNNLELVEKIHQEQQVCLAVKVEIRMLQHKQLQASHGTIESLL